MIASAIVMQISAARSGHPNRSSRKIVLSESPISGTGRTLSAAMPAGTICMTRNHNQ